MERYDLHIHSFHSPCSVMRPSSIIKSVKKKGLNGIAIADHNSFKGSQEIYKLNKDANLEIVPAMEIKTQFGDVLVYYIQNEIKKTDFYDVVEEAKSQDALISIAHPFRLMPHLRFRQDLKTIKNKIDAIEAFNSRNFFWENAKASNAAELLGLAKTAGSDAHFSFEIGHAVTLFKDDLRKAIKEKKTKVCGTTITGLPASLLSAVIRRWKLLKTKSP